MIRIITLPLGPLKFMGYTHAGKNKFGTFTLHFKSLQNVNVYIKIFEERKRTSQRITIISVSMIF